LKLLLLFGLSGLHLSGVETAAGATLAAARTGCRTTLRAAGRTGLAAAARTAGRSAGCAAAASAALREQFGDLRLLSFGNCELFLDVGSID
jgi:hypothetical protein